MQRYGDKIVILKSDNDDVYSQKESDYEEIYTGRCNAFLRTLSGEKQNGGNENNYEIVVPDRTMPEIGENYKVGIRFKNTQAEDKEWDVVGFVRNFVRYDRVCNIYIDQVKDAIIEKSIPET